jgi:hypothetical protein
VAVDCAFNSGCVLCVRSTLPFVRVGHRRRAHTRDDEATVDQGLGSVDRIRIRAESLAEREGQFSSLHPANWLVPLAITKVEETTRIRPVTTRRRDVCTFTDPLAN